MKTCLLCDRFRYTNTHGSSTRKFQCVRGLISRIEESLSEGPLYPSTLVVFQFAEVCPYFDEIATFRHRRESMEKELLVRFE